MERKLKEALKNKAEKVQFSEDVDIQQIKSQKQKPLYIKKWGAPIVTVAAILLAFVLLFSYEDGLIQQASPSNGEWHSVKQDIAQLQKLQNEVDQGHKPGYLTPSHAAMEYMRDHYIIDPDILVEVQKQSGKTYVLVTYPDHNFIKFKMYQPIKEGNHGIWAVEEYKVTKEFNKKHKINISKEEAIAIAEAENNQIKHEGKFVPVKKWIKVELRNFVHNKQDQPRKHWYLQGQLEVSSYVAFGIDAVSGDVFYGEMAGEKAYENILIDHNNIEQIKIEEFNNYITINNRSEIRTFINSLNGAKLVNNNRQPSGEKLLITLYKENDYLKFEFYPEATKGNILELKRNLYFHAPKLNDVVKQYSFMESPLLLDQEMAYQIIKKRYSNISKVIEVSRYETDEFTGKAQIFYRFVIETNKQKQRIYHVDAENGDIYINSLNAP